MKLVGIDRWRGGWLVVESDRHLGKLTFGLAENLTDYLASIEGSEVIAVVDIPIGLPDSRPRRVDQAARRLVGSKRASSVFPVPMRAALAGETYEAASALNYVACGKKLSRQAFGILPGIRELDAFMTPARQAWLREGHPEVTFAVLNDERVGVAAPKKSAEGLAVRTQLLGRVLDVPDIERVRERLGLRSNARDDIVDALAMLVSAGRIHRGDAVLLPLDSPEYDSHGLRMEMVV